MLWLSACDRIDAGYHARSHGDSYYLHLRFSRSLEDRIRNLMWRRTVWWRPNMVLEDEHTCIPEDTRGWWIQSCPRKSPTRFRPISFRIPDSALSCNVSGVVFIRNNGSQQQKVVSRSMTNSCVFHYTKYT